MNLKVIVALALVVVAALVGVSSFRKTVTPYISFAEARKASGMVQVNGTLADKQYVLKQQEQYLSFRLKDDKGEVLPVEFRGVIPGNFDQATSIVAIGRYHEGRFEADQLLVKCPSKYQAEAEKARNKT
ncbi:MAG: cytochrome c maturation protein CcmE [Candidatus Eisenbacteria bacterium]|uniref:Cytochrome c maturation protein CcmE n=1 Tax=Eiseniibacteriota bacterium TaxID=2212470 RepID=A0A9D6LC01_UNCEI|nr:cytochrome c maturation protein CcmE [Candidatus Eisenbacteria bacterium]MBI3540348.1 cytochrome c maturation protein CcmE [Candidatus Eisenbacteria bacterium]